MFYILLHYISDSSSSSFFADQDFKMKAQWKASYTLMYQ